MKSMKSKSSKRKERNRSPLDDKRSKRSKPSTKVDKKDKGKWTARKSRWQAVEAADTSKKVPAPDNTKPEKSGPPLRIKDLLHDKEKIVDLLFQTVTGTALQELIPDYLQKRSQDDLKKLCLEQIKLISDDVILQIISGKSMPDTKDIKLEKEERIKTEKPDAVQEKKNENKVLEKKPDETSSLEASDTASSDVLELHTTAVEMESILDEENQIPLVIKDEVAKDLITPERDAELLELEMRARAIRSLLRAKSQLQQEESLRDTKDENK